MADKATMTVTTAALVGLARNDAVGREGTPRSSVLEPPTTPGGPCCDFLLVRIAHTVGRLTLQLPLVPSMTATSAKR